jgi:hypothetical protein
MFNYLGMKDQHKWQVTMLRNTLIFMEWLPEERKDTGTKFFKQQLFSRWANPFQTLVMQNQHLFNNMMLWEGKFNYFVFTKEGELISTNRHG